MSGRSLASPSRFSQELEGSTFFDRWFYRRRRLTNLVLGLAVCVLVLLIYMVPLVCFLSCGVSGDTDRPCLCQLWAHPFNLLSSALNSLTYGGLNRHFRESAKRLSARCCSCLCASRDDDEDMPRNEPKSKRYSMYSF